MNSLTKTRIPIARMLMAKFPTSCIGGELPSAFAIPVCLGVVDASPSVTSTKN